MCEFQERWSSIKMPRSFCVDTLSIVWFSVLRTSWYSYWTRFFDPNTIYFVLYVLFEIDERYRFGGVALFIAKHY